MVAKLTRKKQSGFSLAELLLATTVLTAALAGILALYSTVMVMNENSKNDFTAMGHAQYVMEEVRATPWANITTEVWNGTWMWGVPEVAAEGLTPLRDESIYTMAIPGDPIDINVMVSWNDAAGSPHTVSVNSKIASP